MRVALLTGSVLFAARFEAYVEAHPEAGMTVAWTVTEPGAVLAALDHDPTIFLLDMRWRQQALEAARVLKEAGVPLMVSLWERLDDPLIPLARAMGLEVVELDPTWSALLHRLQETG